jgi:Histone methylation protein DOT1
MKPFRKGASSQLVDPKPEEAAAIASALKELDLDGVLELQCFYDELVNEFPLSIGKAISKRNREGLQLQISSLVYGETEFRSLGNVIEKIKQVYGRPNVGYSGMKGILQKSGGIFYDLGSGTGKPVLAAAILHDFSLCCGIEFLEGLHSVSLEMHSVYNEKIKPKLGRRQTGK